MYNNKQILNSLNAVVDGLKDILDNKDELIKEAKKDMTIEQIKEFEAMEKLMSEKMKNNDYLSAMKLIQKMRIKHEKKNKKEL